MSDLEHVDWELFRLYLSDDSRELGDLLTLLPPGFLADAVRREKVRTAEEEKDMFRRWSESHSEHYYTILLTEEISSLQRYRKRLEELPQIEVLYTNPTFEQTCLAAAIDFQDIADELIAYFALHPEELHQMEWRNFEYLLDAIFRNQGYRTELGPGRGDAGVDLRLVQKDSIGELVTLVQAKRYSPQNPIHLEAVAALYGVVEHQQANHGLFVTTSRYLPSATQFAARHSQRLTLADSADIIRWCRSIASA